MAQAWRSLNVVEEARDSLLSSPLRKQDTRVGIATVDCRLCKKTDFGVLLDMTIWGLQTHKASYAYCSKFEVWLAETQGPQRAINRSDWLRGPWSLFDPKDSSGTASIGEVSDCPVFFESISHWALVDFYERELSLKTKLIEYAKEQKDEMLLEQLLRLQRFEILRKDLFGD